MKVKEIVEASNKDLKILWLPIAHCEFNPIELVWSAVKGEVSRRNKTFKIADVLKLILEVINSDCIREIWPRCVEHVIKLENLIKEKENIADEFIQSSGNHN